MSGRGLRSAINVARTGWKKAGSVKDYLDDKFDDFKDELKEFTNEFSDKFKARLKNAILGAWSIVTDRLKDAVDKAKSAGEWIIDIAMQVIGTSHLKGFAFLLC